MKKVAILIMIITVFSKIFGFLRDIALSYFYGASSISDVYLIALAIPGAIFSILGTGIATGYIPMYSKIAQEQGLEAENKFTNNLINVVLVMCTLLVIFGLLFTSQIVKAFASGFEGETLELAVRFTKISLLGMYFSGVIYIFAGFLQIKGNYHIPALVGFPPNLIIIISIYISTKTDIMVLAIGGIIATASPLILLIPSMYKKGYKYKYILDIKDKNILNMAYIALPVIIGVSVDQINMLVDKTLASNIAIGGISALDYANKLNLFVQGIFVLSLSAVMYPMISKLAAENDITGLKKLVTEVVNVINLLVVPATIGVMIFAEPLVKFLFGRGAFNSNAVTMTSTALLYYSIGMIGYGLREILSRTFYSLHDTKTPMVNAAIALILNIVLNLILSRYMGIGGLALATSISAIFCTTLLFISLRKKIGPIGIKNLSISFLKILCASLVMGLLAKLTYNYLTTSISQNLSLLISIVIGSFTYFIIIYFMKIEDVEVMVNVIKRKIKKNAV